jgi:predicted metal-dependent enzyme (double-stranded beta helix superfamily)
MDWLVNARGECVQLSIPPDFSSESPYKLYRFLTDIEDLLGQIQSDRLLIQGICPLVRRLLTSSTWIQLTELTVQMVSWLPDQISPIHNHGTWGIVAIINGVEKNQFWDRVGDRKFPDKIKPVGDRTLGAGDIIGFTSEAIHSIRAIEATISFNIYGETNYDQRFEFNPVNASAQLF